MTKNRPPPPSRFDYEVGYGRPPKRSQFPPGRSGNTKGRPKGSKNFSTLFAEELALPVILTESGKRRRMQKRQALAKQIVNGALSNNSRSMTMALDQIRHAEGSIDAPIAIDAQRPESRLVMESIVRRIRLNAEAEKAVDLSPDYADEPRDDFNAHGEDEES